MKQTQTAAVQEPVAGLAGWLVDRIQAWLRQRWAARQGGTRRAQPRLALLERIPLAPRQSLALVEAEGRRFLVVTSAEGAPAFHALDRPAHADPRRHGRVSW